MEVFLLVLILICLFPGGRSVVKATIGLLLAVLLLSIASQM